MRLKINNVFKKYFGTLLPHLVYLGIYVRGKNGGFTMVLHEGRIENPSTREKKIENGPGTHIFGLEVS